MILLITVKSELKAQRNIEVNDFGELQKAVSVARAGDVIILSEGNFNGEPLLISANGSKQKPIVIKAKVQGKTFIKSQLKLFGDYIHLKGLHFIEAGKLDISAIGCKVSRCIWTDVNTGKWIQVWPTSSQIEFDYNTFQNKTSNKNFPRDCQLMQIFVLNKNERHHFHHNLFKDIPQGTTGNGFETIQLITKDNPFDPEPGASNTIIENNLFLRCNGEGEIISIKSNGNLLRRNTFRACKGALVLRHGDNNIVTENYFFGDGESGSGGVRIQGTGQVVVNNYFSNLGSYGLGMMDGTPDNLYIRVENAKILFNTFINCKKTFSIGINHTKHPNGTVPKDCLIAGNIFYTKNIAYGTLIEFIKGDQPENWEWLENIAVGNMAWKVDGIHFKDPFLELQDNELLFPTSKTPKMILPENIDEKIKSDLFGEKWELERTVGAIQYPVNSTNNLPLTEEMVGAGSSL
jgi:poly(beta-D-mannuronate) lyase